MTLAPCAATERRLIMKKLSMKRAASAVAFAALTMPACAHASGGPDIREQIQQRANALGADWVKHDAGAIASNYFTRDVTALGEGGKELVDGAAQLRKTLQELFKQATTARLEVHMAKPLGPNAAYAWVVWDCNFDQAPAAQFKVRSLYVFRREGGQWKIAADAYSMGDIPK
jgi:ketosteroid isomerase-like protein